MAPTRVALALGSGGARGYAHIGVIQVLEERGYEITSIAGTSMGAVVGGLHAAGQLDAYTEWVTGLTQRQVLRLLDPSITSPGVIRAQKILAKVSTLLGGAEIEHLPIPFTAVATDLFARKEVWFERGPVDAAIRASMALPSVITPVVLHGRLLVDGGLLNPIPIAATSGARADVTIAVSLSEEHHTLAGATPAHESGGPDPTDEEPGGSVSRSAAQVLDSDMVRSITGWLGRDRGEPAGEVDTEAVEEIVGRLEEHLDEGKAEEAEEVEEEMYGELPPGLRTLDVMRLSLDAIQSVVTRYRLAGYPPDVLITVPKASCGTLDFHRATEMIELGRERALEALDRASSSP